LTSINCWSTGKYSPVLGNAERLRWARLNVGSRCFGANAPGNQVALAPELWEEVRAAADRTGKSPDDWFADAAEVRKNLFSYAKPGMPRVDAGRGFINRKRLPFTG
jgi:hypothetical protein